MAKCKVCVIIKDANVCALGCWSGLVSIFCHHVLVVWNKNGNLVATNYV